MRVLIADKLSSFVPGRLQDLGARVEVEPQLGDDALAARLKDFDPEVLVVRSTKVKAAHFAAAKGLALVVRAGAGVNNIDMEAASARGVYVANCPGKNASAVAELAIGHLLNLDRSIADNVIALRAKQWNKKLFGQAQGLRGRTLAVLGYGNIGREVATVARAMGMRVVVWSRFAGGAPQDEDIEIAPTIEAAVAGADAVSVHLPLSADTDKRIGVSVFSAMKAGAYFINTSRGEVVDHAALIDACNTKGIRAGLDVFAAEPSAGQAPFEDPIAEHASVYGTHHIGASTQQAEDAVGEETIRIVTAYANAQPVPNCVNLSSATEATHVVVVRHADRVGVLAHVLHHLRDASMNVQGMQNVVFTGNDAAACARIEVIGEPSAALLCAIASHADIFSATASAL